MRLQGESSLLSMAPTTGYADIALFKVFRESVFEGVRPESWK